MLTSNQSRNRASFGRGTKEVGDAKATTRERGRIIARGPRGVEKLQGFFPGFRKLRETN